MHNSFYFFQHLIPRLSEIITGSRLVSCFSQDKDELILEFNDGSRAFFFRVIFSPQISILVFPDGYRRARRNSIDLFHRAILGQVTEVRLFNHERSFLITLDHGYHLIFKMHGPSGNVWMYSDSEFEIFRKSLKSDLVRSDFQLDRTIDWSINFFRAHHQSIAKYYFTFGKEIWRWLTDHEYESLEIDEKYNLIMEAISQMSRSNYYLCQTDSEFSFSLLPFGTNQYLSNDPIDAVNSFYSIYSKNAALISRKRQLIKDCMVKIKSLQASIEKAESRKFELSQNNNFKEWADLLMAHLDQIKEGDPLWSGESFDQPGIIHHVKLRPELSPQKNAEIYYRKSRNRNQERVQLENLITQYKMQLDQEQHRFDLIRNTDDLKVLNGLADQSAPIRNNKAIKRLPYQEYIFMDYIILVGRSATDNDELTFRIASKEDHWLHVRDVSGSHVIIRRKPGQVTPRPVIERAAALAAYHSKRKGESLCPVSLTSRKYVRKRKGDPAGTVVVEREEVLLVEPAS